MTRLVLLMLVAMGCGSADLEAPPEIAYGLEECSYCRMIISEERAAAVWIGEAGSVSKFDDLGCLLAARSTGGSGVDDAGAVWAHDALTHGWLRAEEGWFVAGDEAGTPMGSGILAFADRAAAGRHGSGDQILGWSELLASGAGTRADERQEGSE